MQGVGPGDRKRPGQICSGKMLWRVGRVRLREAPQGGGQKVLWPERGDAGGTVRGDRGAGIPFQTGGDISGLCRH